MKKGKIFTFLCVVTLIIGGFFLSQNINVQGSNSSQQVNQATQYENVSIENVNQNTQTINIVYDVIFIDFNDQTCINGRLNQTFDDYIKTYNTVTDYIYLLSNHKVNVIFNYYQYKIDASAYEVTHAETKNYDGFASKYYKNIINNRQCLQYNGANPVLNILQFATATTISTSHFAWPCNFTFYDKENCEYLTAISVLDFSSSLTILHELMHSLGLPDLYSNINFYCTLSYDIMSSSTLTPPSLNAYMREYLGWISSSSYNDDQQTEIEYINESGRYRLYYPSNLNQTIAYSFGTRNKETFYIEARCLNSTTTILQVNRVNTYYACLPSNYLYTVTDPAECYVIDVAKIDSNNLVISNEGTPSNKNVICYANGDYASYAIGNVTFNDNYLEFDFSTTGNFDFLLQVNAVDTSNNKLANAFVYVNDEYNGTTNANGVLTCKVGADDVVTVLHPDTKNSQQYTVVKGVASKTFVFEAVTKSSNETTPSITPSNTIALTYTINISLSQTLTGNTSLSNYYYLDNSALSKTPVQVYVDNVLVTASYNGSYILNLKNYSTILINTKQKSVSYTFDSSSKTLKESLTGQRVYCQNNCFDVNINIDTIKYALYMTVKDNPDKRIGIKAIYAYNATTGTWETLSCISSFTECYPMTFYLTSDYTKVKFDYQNWFEYNSYCFDIPQNQTKFLFQLQQNIIQSGLDWFVNLFK